MYACALNGVDSRYLVGTDGFWKHYSDTEEEFVCLLQAHVNESRRAHLDAGNPDEKAWLKALGANLRQTAEKRMASTHRTDISLFLSIVALNECDDKILPGDSFSKPNSEEDITQVCRDMPS